MIEWNNQDAAALSDFLSKPSGQKFLACLLERRPRLGGETLEEAAMNAKIAEGAEDTHDLITSMSTYTSDKAQPSRFVRVRDHSDAASINRPTPAR